MEQDLDSQQVIGQRNGEPGGSQERTGLARTREEFLNEATQLTALDKEYRAATESRKEPATPHKTKRKLEKVTGTENAEETVSPVKRPNYETPLKLQEKLSQKQKRQRENRKIENVDKRAIQVLNCKH